MLLAAAATAAPAAIPSFVPPKPVGSAAQAVLPPINPVPPPQTFVASHFPWLTHGLAGLFVLSAVALVFLLAVQTTKQEGLTGSIGGRVESAYRGRLGAEEQLKRWTGYTAVAFVISALVLSLTGIEEASQMRKQLGVAPKARQL